MGKGRKNIALTEEEEIAKLITLRDLLLKDLNRLKSLDATLRTADGRTVITDIIKGCNLFGQVYENSQNTAFNLGVQDAGKKILLNSIRSGHKFEVKELLSDEEIERLSNVVPTLDMELTEVINNINKLKGV
jgi:hypothetical protein